LDLSECSSLGDTGAAKAAAASPALANLSLVWCWELTDAGVAAVIKSCPKLVRLELVGLGKLTSEGLRGLFGSQTLETLDLQQCAAIDDKELAMLTASLSNNVRVIDYYGNIVGEESNGKMASSSFGGADDRRDEGDKEVYSRM